MNRISKLAILALSALPLSEAPLKEASNPNPIKGFEMYEGQYVSDLLIGDVSHDYLGKRGYFNLAYFQAIDNANLWFFFTIHIHSSGQSEGYFTFETTNSSNLIDFDRSKLPKPNDKYYFVSANIEIFFNKPLKVTGLYDDTKQYLRYTNTANSFAGGYDGFIPGYYYHSIAANYDYLSKLTSSDSPITGLIWKSGDVSSLNIKQDDWTIQYYYVDARKTNSFYQVFLCGFGKNSEGKVIDLDIKELGFTDFSTAKTHEYFFPQPISVLSSKTGYYNVIRSKGAYGISEGVFNYQEGYKTGQGNPTFKTFIVSSMDACSAFFNLPVLGEKITVGTLIGSFIGLGALFLLIKLFR